MNRLKLWMGIGSSAVVVAVWLIGFVFDYNAVLDYGKIGDVFVRPPEVTNGESAQVCFRNVTWLRLCPTTLTERVKLGDYNYELTSIHRVHVPEKVGPIAPKCRQLVLPRFPVDASGEAVYSATVESHCGIAGVVIRQTLTGIKFLVKP